MPYAGRKKLKQMGSVVRVLLMIAFSCTACMPSTHPSEAIREMARRIRLGLPLAGLNVSDSDETWGTYLLFGDERDESGI